jgi:hypothetical protein
MWLVAEVAVRYRRSSRVSVQICMILTSGSPSLSVSKLAEDLAARFGKDKSLAGLETQENVIAFQSGGVQAYLTPVDSPFPWSDLSGPCLSSVLWKNAKESLETHQGHIIVAVSGAASEIELSKALSRISVSTMNASDGSLGVYWANATLIVPKDIFAEFVERLMPAGAPLPIWVDFRVGRRDDSSSFGFTTGLNALGHKEFEVSSCPDSPGELRERLELLAHYVLENGAVFNNGDTVGADEKERIFITHRSSEFGQSGEVIHLSFRQPAKKRFFGLFG